MTPNQDALEPELGNDAYWDWVGGTISAATRQPVPWLAVRLAISLDRIIRAHEAESTGGPKCAECLVIEECEA